MFPITLEGDDLEKHPPDVEPGQSLCVSFADGSEELKVGLRGVQHVLLECLQADFPHH